MEKHITSTPGHTPQEPHGGSSSVETVSYSFEGLHDYISNLRILGFIFNKEGKDGLFKHLSETKLETLHAYIEKVKTQNKDLYAKIQRDISSHPDARAEIEALIATVNESTTPEAALDAYQDLQSIFKNKPRSGF